MVRGQQFGLVIGIAVTLFACVGPTQKPLPLSPSSEAAKTQFVLEESYWATMDGVIVHLPYGVYRAELEDERGVYYRAPYPIKRKWLLFGSEQLVEGGIFLPTSSAEKWLGFLWVYMVREAGPFETHQLPGAIHSGEGSLWRIEPAGSHISSFASQVDCSGGVPDGSYLSTNTGGDRIVGEFCEGLRCGRFEIFTRSEVRIAEFPYRDGVIDGQLDLWYNPESAPDYPSRHKARFMYSGGRRNGLSKYWCSNGLRRAEVSYADGLIEMASAWSCDGRRISGKQASLVARDLQAKDEEYFEVLLSTLDEAAPSCDPPA